MIIINADDFGMNEHCSKAIAKAFSLGLVTDTTVMSNGSYFFEAVKLAKENGFDNKIGVHLNVTEGTPLTEDIKKLPDFVKDGRFAKLYSWEKGISSYEKEAVYNEFTAQIERIENIGITITHADSHHYIHNAPFIAPIAEKACVEHGIKKIRIQKNWGNISKDKKTEADSYKKRLRSKGFITTEFFGRLSEAEDAEIPDNIELLVHPDFDKNGNLIDRRSICGGFPAGYDIPSLKNKTNAASGNYNILS